MSTKQEQKEETKVLKNGAVMVKVWDRVYKDTPANQKLNRVGEKYARWVIKKGASDMPKKGKKKEEKVEKKVVKKEVKKPIPSAKLEKKKKVPKKEESESENDNESTSEYTSESEKELSAGEASETENSNNGMIFKYRPRRHH